jgi:5-(carboxyamino)imidazole ribonucleotide synthase
MESQLPFKICESETAILTGIEKGEIHFPFVQKLRKGGYDGRGVAVINNKSDLKKYFQEHR